MPAELALAEPPEKLWRVERKTPPLGFSYISPAEATVDGAGNRFDIPGAGVLYAATTPAGSFAETMAQFRPKASLIEKMAAAANDGEAPPAAGVLDVSWRSRRMLRSLRTVDALPFIDIESPESHTFITTNAPALLRSLNVENLDVSSVRGPSRLLTRGIAGWLYGQTDDQGSLLYGGIRYVSRLGDYECWAIFDGTEVSLIEEQAIEPANAEMAAVAAIYNIEIQ
jgi:hypothetical protein